MDASAPCRDPSSDQLRARVANFMDRAEETLSHAVAEQSGSMKMDLHFDRATGSLVGVEFDHNNLDKASWAYVALLMRPIIFVTKDPISVPKLTSGIEREHEALRGALKPFRARFAEWENHVYMAFQDLGPAPVPLPDGETRVTSLWTGPPNTVPETMDVTGSIGDAVFADVFFNGCLWHGDDEKTDEYHRASRLMKAHMAKCAEIRTLTAIPFVRALSEWITAQRTVGYDL